MNQGATNSVRVGRFDVHYRVYGAGMNTAPPIVCVNGLQQTMAAWKRFVSHFRRKCPVVVFDLPNQGRSTVRSGRSHIRLAEQQAVLAAVVDAATGGRPVHLFSCSWGGAVAAAYAAAHPERVDRLILASFGLAANAKMRELIALAREAIRAGRQARCGELIVDGFGDLAPPQLKRQILSQFQSLSAGGIESFYEHIGWSVSANLEDEIAFSRIAADTLIINGSEDTIVDLPSLARLEAAIPRSTRKQIEGAGHFLHFEDPSFLHVYEAFFVGNTGKVPPAASTPNRPLTLAMGAAGPYRCPAPTMPGVAAASSHRA